MQTQRHYALPRNYVAIGEYLKEGRLVAGLTQRDISLHLGYSSAQFISNFERGIAIPPLKKLKALQKIIDIDVEKFTDLAIAAQRAIMWRTLKLKNTQKLNSKNERSVKNN